MRHHNLNYVIYTKKGITGTVILLSFFINPLGLPTPLVHQVESPLYETSLYRGPAFNYIFIFIFKVVNKRKGLLVILSRLNI